MIISQGLPHEILTKKIVKCNENILITHKFYEFRDFISPGLPREIEYLILQSY